MPEVILDDYLLGSKRKFIIWLELEKKIDSKNFPSGVQ